MSLDYESITNLEVVLEVERFKEVAEALILKPVSNFSMDLISKSTDIKNFPINASIALRQVNFFHSELRNKSLNPSHLTLCFR